MRSFAVVASVLMVVAACLFANLLARSCGKSTLFGIFYRLAGLLAMVMGLVSFPAQSQPTDGMKTVEELLATIKATTSNYNTCMGRFREKDAIRRVLKEDPIIINTNIPNMSITPYIYVYDKNTKIVNTASIFFVCKNSQRCGDYGFSITFSPGPSFDTNALDRFFFKVSRSPYPLNLLGTDGRESKSYANYSTTPGRRCIIYVTAYMYKGDLSEIRVER